MADEITAMARAISTHLKPRTTAYKEIWLTPLEGEEEVEVDDKS